MKKQKRSTTKKVRTGFCILMLLCMLPMTVLAYEPYQNASTYGEEVWDYFYEKADDAVYWSIADPACTDKDDPLSCFFIQKYDAITNYPSAFSDYLCIDHIQEFVIQETKKGALQIAVKGRSTEIEKNCSVLIDIAKKKVVNYQLSDTPVTSYKNDKLKKCLSPTQVIQTICEELDYDNGDYVEGGITLYYIPKYGYVYLVGGGYWNFDNIHQDEYGIYYDTDRVNAIMNPLTGELLAYEHMPYCYY